MKKIKSIMLTLFLTVSLFASAFSQSTTNSYTSTLKFNSSDMLQEYNATRMIVSAISSLVPTFTGTPWVTQGNAVTANNRILGSTDNFPFSFITNSVVRGAFLSTGEFTIGTSVGIATASPACSLHVIGNSFLDHQVSTGKVLTLKTLTANTIGTLFTNGSDSLKISPITLSGGSAVYNGPWIHTSNNIHFHAGAGVPQLTIARTQSGNNPIILNGNTSYTSSAILRVNVGGLSNLIECEGTANNLTWIVQKGTNTANQAIKGYATIGSTVLTAGQPSLLTIGTTSASSTSSLNGLQLVSGGYSVTAKVIDATAGDAATINSPIGQFRKDATGTTFVLTNSQITDNSIIMLTPANAAIDVTAINWTISKGAGVATITFNLAPTANFDMMFMIMN